MKLFCSQSWPWNASVHGSIGWLGVRSQDRWSSSSRSRQRAWVWSGDYGGWHYRGRVYLDNQCLVLIERKRSTPVVDWSPIQTLFWLVTYSSPKECLRKRLAVDQPIPASFINPRKFTFPSPPREEEKTKSGIIKPRTVKRAREIPSEEEVKTYMNVLWIAWQINSLRTAINLAFQSEQAMGEWGTPAVERIQKASRSMILGYALLFLQCVNDLNFVCIL